jgi:GT2 family glycosyltransferase
MSHRDLNARMDSLVLNGGKERVTADLAVPSSVVTVVIVNWNSGTMLRACLAAATRKAGDLDVKVVVVDNLSRDGSAELVEREFPAVRLIRAGRNLGFGRGNNLAKAHARPGYVLFLNPDTELLANALELMVDFLATHPETGAVGCKMVFPDGEVADQNLQWFPNPLTEFVVQGLLPYGMVKRLEGILPWNDPQKSGYVQKLFGGCFLVRTSVLDKVGWFDERFFMYAEDVDLSRRIREAGWELYYLSDAGITHVAGGATRKAGGDFSILMGCESMEKLIAKYQGRLAGLAYRGGTFAASAIRLCLLLLSVPVAAAFAPARSASCRQAARNCALRIKWALGLRSVLIPD